MQVVEMSNGYTLLIANCMLVMLSLLYIYIYLYFTFYEPCVYISLKQYLLVSLYYVGIIIYNSIQ